MVDPVLLVALAGITGATPLVVAVIPLMRARVSERMTHVMLGLSAGILLSLSLMNLLPESLELGADMGFSAQLVAFGAVVGFLSLLVLERRALAAGADARHVHYENGRKIQPFGTLAMSALAIHGLLDGFVIPLAFFAGEGPGIVVTAVVALHQIPDSFAAAAIGLASTHTRRAALRYVLVTAIDTPIGIGIGFLFLTAGAAILPFGLAFSAGTFLFVSAADLVPELQHRARSLLVTASILSGFAIVAALTMLLPGA